MTALDLEQYRALVEQAPTMMWRAGPDGTRDYVNARWLAFTGRTMAEEVGTGWEAGVHPDDIGRCRARYAEEIERQGGFEIELRLRRHDGVYRWVMDCVAPYAAADGSFAGFVGTCVDIDDRRDRRMAEAVELFEMSLDNLAVVGFDGYLKRVNPSWTRTLGWTAEELMALPSIELVHPDDRANVMMARQQLRDGAPLHLLVNRYRCRDGSYRWLEWRSVAHGDRGVVFAAARDVTEQREAQEATRVLSESLTTMLNSIADGVIATDARGGIVRMNPVAETLTGWEAAAAVGRPLGEVFHVLDADTRARAALPMEGTLEEGLAVEIAKQTLLVAKDGREVAIASSCAAMRSVDERITGIVLVFRDMSADNAARDVRDELRRQLMVSDRMVSVGTLATGVAHEINNPLAYVTANLDMLAEQLAAPGPNRASNASWVEMAQDAREGAERIRKVVRGLMTFSRGADERPAVIDVVPLLEVSINLAQNEIRHHARLVKDFGPVPPIAASDARLGQVFINLLVNAAHAVTDGGGDDNEIRITTMTDARGRAVIEIADTGPGIPADTIGRVFDPFFTTRPVGGGTGLGLGLWVCHSIITRMGGEITVTSEPGSGAAFRVSLPPAPARLILATRAVAALQSPARRAAVLVVDDEPTIGVTLVRVLSDQEVTVVTSGGEALALIAAGASFDVILADLMMPGMSGMELYDELVRSHPQAALRVVFVTGAAFTPAAEAFLARVPNERIEKPFNVAFVRAMVERLTA